MKRHDAPFVSHWLQAYANDVGLFVQLPRVEVRVCPTSAVPWMTGAFVFLGTAVLAARLAPGCPKTAPSTAPAITASTSASLVRVVRFRCIGPLLRSVVQLSERPTLAEALS